MNSRRSRNIIREIAEKEDLSVKQVNEITGSFFSFTAQQMSKGDRKSLIFDTIRLFKFGVFRVKEGRKRYLKPEDEKSNKYRNRSANDLSGSVDDQRVQSNLESGPFD